MSQLVQGRITPDLGGETRENIRILRNTSLSKEARAAAHAALEEDADLENLITNLFTHVEASDMADYWRDFLTMTDALMQNVHAVHECNWDEFVISLRAMLPWMLAYDNNRYGRWLSDFWAMLTALPADQVEFFRTDFAQSITGNSYSNMAWDMWIECTMNKGSKMKSGWLSILQNEKQLLVHSRNGNNVARIRTAYNVMANQEHSKRLHKECGPKRMREDEQCVQDLVACMHEFDSSPFDPSSPTLRTLQSAMPASDELVEDFNMALAAGEEKLTNFLRNRVFSKNTSLHAPVPLSRRLTFAKTPDMKNSGEVLKHMKLCDPFPSSHAFKTLLCSVSNKGRLQKLIKDYMTELAQSTQTEIIYSVGSHCTNLSTQEPVENFTFDQSEADTVFFSIYSVLRESGYSGPVVLDSVDTDAYVAAAVISRQLPGMLCIKRKHETIFCRGLVTDEMADCIVQLHCMTGCDANSGFFGKGKNSVYDRVAKSPSAQQQLLQCGNSLDLDE
ncbi:hypothetical protein ACOMHN_018917 [Nucella lapillus]